MGFGIAGALFAVGAFLMPIGFNLVASWIALVCAAIVVASRRGASLAVVIWIVCASNLFLLNSETRAVLLGGRPNGPTAAQLATIALYLTIASFAAPALAAALSRAMRPGAHVDQETPAPAPSLASAPEIVDADTISAAPVRQELALPAPRLRSTTARILLLLATMIGAAAVVIVLRFLDAPTPALGHGAIGNSAAATAI